MRVLTLSAVLVSSFLLPAQGSELARYRIAGEEHSISRDQLALELARRHRQDETGKAALEVLIDSHLIEDRAREAGLLPDREAIDRRVREIEQVLQANGQDLGTWIQERGMDRQQFEERYVRLNLAHMRLVRKDLEIPAEAEVSPDQLRLWLAEARNQVAIEQAPERLPSNTAARVGEESISLLEFGRVLLQSSSRDDREDRIRQVVLRGMLEARAEELGVSVSPQEARDHVMARKRDVEGDPRYGGLSYENLLKSQGTTVEELIRSPVTRANVLQEKIVNALYPESELMARVEEDREAVLAEHGPRRRIRLIVVRARQEPDEQVQRDFIAARAHIQSIRHKITAEGLRFAEAARLYSEHPYTQETGGDIGAHARASTVLPTEVMETVFGLELLELSEPLRSADGWFLAMVTEIEDDPSDRELVARLRQECAAELQKELLDAAGLEILTASPR